MKLKPFNKAELKRLYKPKEDSSGEDNGQVTIIGGSSLFHGAPLLSLKVASRIVDMVFFASPEPGLGELAELMKSKLFSFIWIPWEETERYIEKSDAVLIGPGFMRYRQEAKDDTRDRSRDEVGRLTREITKRFLTKFPEKKWVIDAGSLQVMDTRWIPKDTVLTPNRREFELLFDIKPSQFAEASRDQQMSYVKSKAKKFTCIIVLKGPETLICSADECAWVKGGNPGLTKGGMGDILAGLTVAILAKNEPFLAACCASYIAKAAADELYSQVGTNYNADDLADKIPLTLKKLLF